MSFGSIDILTEETLGVGSYGKVCKAKCGKLPCAAKLLHDTMFGTNDPGIHRFVERFEQESKFLRMIKHPNIVQFLGTFKDPKSQRLALLMELMDESLTQILERSSSHLPYHTQLNICYDVALALSYLHSNDIIHRDLSSNNVLLSGEGTRAKVTDFGMSKLVGMNPCKTGTMCPGTVAYMPPEALITPPRYSDKLDCFSHGVLTIQLITRQFPNPGDAHVEDANEETFRRVPETERRKKDIDLVDPDHPLLSLALSCLKGKATERPSAEELCERLAALKCEPQYEHSVKQSKRLLAPQKLLEQAQANQEIVTELRQRCATFQKQIEKKDDMIVKLERARANHAIELLECQATLQQKIVEKDGELERVKAEHQTELDKKCSEYETELKKKENVVATIINDCQTQVQAKETLVEKLRKENSELQQQISATKSVPGSPTLPVSTYPRGQSASSLVYINYRKIFFVAAQGFRI